MSTFQKNNKILRDSDVDGMVAVVSSPNPQQSDLVGNLVENVSVAVSTNKLATPKRDRAESTSVSGISTLEIPTSKAQMERVHRYLKDAMEQDHEADIPIAQTKSLGRMIDRLSERGSIIQRCKLALRGKSHSF